MDLGKWVRVEMAMTLPLFLQKLFLIGKVFSVNFIIEKRSLVKILYQNSHF